MVWTGFRRNCIGALRQRQRWRRASSSPPSAASLPHRQMLKQERTKRKRDLTTLFSDNAKPQERDCISVPHHILRNIKELTHFLEGWETGEISPEGGILPTRAHKLKKRKNPNNKT